MSYARSPEQVQEAEQMLTKLRKREQLDLPLELALMADDEEHLREEMEASQVPDSPYEGSNHDFDDGVEYLNLINAMEG